MTQRSPKLEDPRFLEKKVVPRWPQGPASAFTIFLDSENNFSILDVVDLADQMGQSPQEVIDDMNLPENPIAKFKDRYPESDFLDLASRQDPADIAELDEIAGKLNAVLGQRNATRASLTALQMRVDAVYNKYKT